MPRRRPAQVNATGSIERKEMPLYTDQLPLIRLVRKTMSDLGGFRSFPVDDGTESRRLGYLGGTDSRRGTCIVTADDAALELGSPLHSSIGTLLWTAEDCFNGSMIHVAGHDLQDMKAKMASFVMTVMVRIPDGFDPSPASFNALLNLSHRIPGYMSRSVPGKLWIRISRDLMKRGFTLLSLGQCLAYSFREAVPGLPAIEILLAADDEELTRAFTGIHTMARAISGRNRKLALEADGTLSCEDLNCNSCDEKKDCDTIRDIIKKRKN